MTSGTTKPRRKIFTRSPLAYELILTARDRDILLAIALYRLLTSVQLSRLFWPPSVLHKLIHWGVGPQQARHLIHQNSAAYIDEKIELLKWLLKINQIRLAKGNGSSTDHKLVDWLREFAYRNPASFAELQQHLDQVAQVSPLTWLLHAIEHDLTPPEAFLDRPETGRPRISRACTQRLRLLYDAGYVERLEQSTRLGEGRAPTVYILSKQGRDELARLLKKKPQELYRLELANLSQTQLPHFIRTNDIRIALTLDAEQHGFDILEWRDDLTLRRFHQRPSERVTVEFQGKEVTFGIVPDGYFWLKAGERGNSHMFIECDLATVVGRYSQAGAKDWRRKVLGYGEYYKTRYQTAYPEAMKSMRILVVTTSQTRLDHLRSVTEQTTTRGAHRYWFTTFDRLQSGSPLTGHIWERADQDGRYAIV